MAVRRARRAAQLFGDEGAHANVLQAYCVEHARGGLNSSGRSGTRHGFQREAFDDDTAKAVEIQQRGKLDAIPEGSAGGNDGIGKAQRANVDGEVHCVRHSHWVNSSTRARARTRHYCGKI